MDLNPEQQQVREATLRDVLCRLENASRQDVRLVGSILTSGCRLHEKRSAPYTLQFDHLALLRGLLATPGETTPARPFMARCLAVSPTVGNKLQEVPAWVDDLLKVLSSDSDGEARLYGRNSELAADLTHQCRIIHALTRDEATRRHMVCMLPWGSGRSTAAFLAAMHILTSRMGAVLYIAPSAKVAELITQQAASFFAASGWTGALTIACLSEGATDAERYRRLRWDDTQQTLVDWSDPSLIPNFVVAHPETLAEFLLQGHAEYREFLADMELVVLDGADTFYGVAGTHVSMILRRLRLILERYGADYRTFTTVAPSANPATHVARLWGFDQDRETGAEHLDVIKPGEDFAPRPERIMAIWSPPLRFTPTEGARDPHAPLLYFSTTPRQVAARDGLQALLSALTFALAELPARRLRLSVQPGESLIRIPLLTQSAHLSEDDLRNLTIRGARFELVRTPAELRRSDLDDRALVVFGHMGGWPELLHELAHFGAAGSLIIVASGPDPTSRYFVREASSALEERIRHFSGGESRGNDDLWESGSQRLEFAPENAEILKLHLFLAATAQDGITDDEAQRYFGESAVLLLDDLAHELGSNRVAQIAVQGKSVRRYHFAPPAALGRPTWDLHCVEWDRPGRSERLLPIMAAGMGARPFGYVEKLLWNSEGGAANEAGSILLRQGRRLEVLRFTPTSIECAFAGGMEWRPRLSRMNVTLPETTVEPPQKDFVDLLGLTLCLRQIEVNDKGVGHVDVPGYLIDEPKKTLCQGCSARFRTQGLLMRFGAAKNSTAALRHSLEHILKIVLPMFLRFVPDDLEIRTWPGIGDPAEWDIVMYDRHPRGTCYTAALWERDIDWWRHVFKRAYDLLRDCACHEGCWRCLKTFDCCGTGVDLDIRYNEDLSKEQVFLFLGIHLDFASYRQHWAMKVGFSSSLGLGVDLNRLLQDGLALLTHHASAIRRILRDRCAMEVSSDHQQTVAYDDASLTGGYCDGLAIRVWSPKKSGWTERQYIKVLAHEMTHFWQARSGQFSSRLTNYDFDNIELETNIPFRGKLFVEGCAEWVCSHVCGYFGFANEMSEIRQRWGASEYEFGYRLFLFLEYHADIARLLHFLASGDILLEPHNQEQGWRLLKNPRDYEVFLYNDARLALLPQMTSAGWENPEGVQCLRRYANYPHGPLRTASGAVNDAPRSSYVLGRKTPSKDENEECFKGRLQNDHRFEFSLDAPVASVLNRIGTNAWWDLKMQCRKCSDNVSCTIFQACHLHSCGDQLRTTTQLLLQFAKALSEKKQLCTDPSPGTSESFNNFHEARPADEPTVPTAGSNPVEDGKPTAPYNTAGQTGSDAVPGANEGKALKRPNQKLNVNKVSRQELIDLSIVDVMLADRIIEARPFKHIAELRAIKEISDNAFEVVCNHLEVR